MSKRSVAKVELSVESVDALWSAKTYQIVCKTFCGERQRSVECVNLLESASTLCGKR